MSEIGLITYAPGHFHAALVQKETYVNVSPRVHVYAPLGEDLIAHLARVAAFNGRAVSPTNWELEVHACSDPLQRMISERTGNVVVISGRNRGKIDVIYASLQAGFHVLADKPWVIRADDLPLLRRALDLAEAKNLVALDVMTERWEVTSRLQRDLVQDRALFGEIERGTEAQPAVLIESEHFLCKSVAGVALKRPSWFFDVEQVGEGLADVGTHLVDLVPWLLFPNQSIDLDELSLRRATRTPTILSRLDFQKATGESSFPDFLQDQLASGQLLYYCNNTLSYTLRGISIWLNVTWGFDAGPTRGDRHLARLRGTRAIVEIRQGENELYRPEVYVIPSEEIDPQTCEDALSRRLREIQTEFPGVGYERVGTKFRLDVPDALRVGHESHFGEVMRLFLSYVNEPKLLPSWEKANMLAKYEVTTRGVELARS